MAANLLRAGAICTVASELSAAVPFLRLPILTRTLAPAEESAPVGLGILARFVEDWSRRR